MTYTCEIKEQAAQPTISIHTHTPVQNISQVLGQAYGAIFQYLDTQGEKPAGPPYVAYFNMDMQNLDIEVGFPVAHTLAGQGDIHPSQIPGGRMATCMYIGPYDKIGAAYEALQQWMAEKGLHASGMAYEMYLNDPQTTAPAELQTQIAFPLN